VSHVWTVWVVFDRSGVFSKEPPRSLCCHDWVQLIRKYAAPAEKQSVLVKLDYPFDFRPETSATVHPLVGAPTSRTRQPGRPPTTSILIGVISIQVDIALVTGTEIG
jgi:hypothetical protein